MSIYTAFVAPSQLTSPITGYSCRRITKQNIKHFGFSCIADLHSQYPNFPLMCEEYKNSRNPSNSKKFIEAQNRINQEFKKRKKQEKIDYEKNPSICLKCELPNPYEKRNNKFCSRNCANSRGPRTENTKQKISKWAKENPRGFANMTSEERIKLGEKSRKPRKIISCKTCLKNFEVIETSSKEYCSKYCNPNYGGYREGSGRSKSGYYKGIYCGSTYELVWVMFNLYHNIKFEKFFGHITYVKDGIEKKYFPDFIQENTIIEIKGYWTETVDVKADAARKKGFDIQILYKSDLKHHFEWFAETYPNNKLHEMFDDYKPNYEYNCNNCNKIFSSDRKRKTDLKFCSRICAGIYNSKNVLEGRTGNAPASLP